MTPHDRYQRLIDLRGEIKQADDLVAECQKAEGDKLKALQMASEATIKQRQKRHELHEEARRLAKEASDDFLALIPIGDPPPMADETAPTVPVEFASTETIIEGADFAFDTPERHADAFGGNHYTNGISDAFERATNP